MTLTTSAIPASAAAAQSPPPALHPGIALHPKSSASILQAHLSHAFLHGICPDVRVRVFGREYKLHKLILAQAGFFDSLFRGGFSEDQSAGPAPTRATGPTLMVREPVVSGAGGGADLKDGGRVLVLRLDDPNISRAAFEMIIARLYATGPPLALSALHHPTPLHPLTPAFPPDSSFLSPSLPDISPTDQPASPRFLLSLLATSNYLGTPGITSGVLAMVIGSMGPRSVGVYLGFAIGKGIGAYGGEEWEDDEVGARGLEHITEVVPDEGEEVNGEEEQVKEEEGVISTLGAVISSSSLDAWVLPPAASSGSKPGSWQDEAESEEDEAEESSPSLKTKGIKTEPPESPSVAVSSSTKPSPYPRHPADASSRASSSRPSSIISDLISGLKEDPNEWGSIREPDPLFFYGLTSNKIGEACVCWLARWGVNVLNEEVLVFGPAARSTGRLKTLSLSGKANLNKKRSRLTSTLESSFPPIWSLGGLPAMWVRAIIGSDSFFVENEMERYRVARAVLEMRRAQRSELEGGRSHGDGGLGEPSLSRPSSEYYGDDGAGSELSDDLEREEEEGEFEELFAHGIYYTHMTFEELSYISNDICPWTSQPYAPLQTLQTSLWQHQELKSKILASAAAAAASAASSASSSSTALPTVAPAANNNNNAASISDPEIAAAELGISSTTAAIVKELHRVAQRESRRQRRSPSIASAQGPSVLGRYACSLGLLGLASPPLYPNMGGSPSSGLFLSLSSQESRKYWPVPGDDTQRFGEFGGFLPLSGPGPVSTLSTSVADLGPSSGSSSAAATAAAAAAAAAANGGPPTVGPKRSPGAQEKDFFGIGPGMRNAREIFEGEEDQLGASQWSRFEPFRFSVEFWGVEKLKEKQREYSSTIFYAGSYFNVYVQTIRKKDRQVQLGIYLHRQSMLEPIPAASRPPNYSPSDAPPPSHTQYPFPATASSSSTSIPALSTSAPTVSTSIPLLATSPIPITRVQSSGTSTPTQQNPNYRHPLVAAAAQRIGPAGAAMATPTPTSPSNGGSGSTMSTSPSSLEVASQGPPQSFRDPRKIIKCYFSISCPSALGTALTRFASAPDVFSVSQSWGWKSSSLRSEEYLSVVDSTATNNSLDEGVLGWMGTMDVGDVGKLQSLRATVVVGLV